MRAPHLQAAGHRDYETSVGLKNCVVYLKDQWPGDEHCQHYTLQGDYQSEGRNILSTDGVNIPLGSDQETIRRLTQEFVEKNEISISKSYAAGNGVEPLLRPARHSRHTSPASTPFSNSDVLSLPARRTQQT